MKKAESCMLDFTKLCRAHRIPTTTTHHHCRPGWVQVHCPFCASNNWHLGFNTRTGGFACYRCGGLPFWRTLERLLKLGGDETRRVVAEYFSDKPTYLAVGSADAHANLTLRRRDTLKPPPGTGEMQAAHRHYLQRRGFEPDELRREWGLLGTNHLAGKWAWRIVIPIKNGAGGLVAYQGRSIGTAEPKYLMTADAECLESPDTFIYGVDRVPGDSVVIVEGATGVWRIGPGAVGTLGIGWKRPQFNRLRRFSKHFLCFDPEPAAQGRARKLADELALYGGQTEILGGFETDPGEFSPKVVRQIRAVAGL